MGGSNEKAIINQPLENPYKPKNSDYRIWLFGDSILDNSYWNHVDANTTGECLKKLMPDFKINDRSTEELTAKTMIYCLRQNLGVDVRKHYMDRRDGLGIPYEGQDCYGRIRIGRNITFSEKDFIAISVGGNDFALEGEMDPTVILGHVREVVQFYKKKGVKPDHIIMFLPYPPTLAMKAAVGVMKCRHLWSMYSQMLTEGKEFCEQEGIHYTP